MCARRHSTQRAPHTAFLCTFITCCAGVLHCWGTWRARPGGSGGRALCFSARKSSVASMGHSAQGAALPTRGLPISHFMHGQCGFLRRSRARCALLRRSRAPLGIVGCGRRKGQLAMSRAAGSAVWWEVSCWVPQGRLQGSTACLMRWCCCRAVAPFAAMALFAGSPRARRVGD